MADFIELKATDLAAMLCSRVCHDLINPVGAIGNGHAQRAADRARRCVALGSKGKVKVKRIHGWSPAGRAGRVTAAWRPRWKKKTKEVAACGHVRRSCYGAAAQATPTTANAAATSSTG